jgi:hypothetical protein
MSTSFSLPITCTDEKRSQLESLLLANVIVWVFITIVDIIVAVINPPPPHPLREWIVLM